MINAIPLASVAFSRLAVEQASSSDFVDKLAIASIAVLVGFLFNWLLAERRARTEMRMAVAEAKVAAYNSLWPLCRPEIDDPAQRFEELVAWYDKGGGLFLSLEAMVRWKSALSLLEVSKRSQTQNEQLRTDLSWLRTEMKVSVGSYSRREARVKLL